MTDTSKPWLIAYADLPVRNYALHIAWMFLKGWAFHKKIRLELWSDNIRVIRRPDNGGAGNG